MSPSLRSSLFPPARGVTAKEVDPWGLIEMCDNDGIWCEEGTPNMNFRGNIGKIKSYCNNMLVGHPYICAERKFNYISVFRNLHINVWRKVMWQFIFHIYMYPVTIVILWIHINREIINIYEQGCMHDIILFHISKRINLILFNSIKL